MKKLVKVSFIIFIMTVIINFSGNLYAEINASVDLNASKVEYNKDEEFVVDVDLANLNSDKGVIITGAKLEYDKNKLECIGMDAGEGWSEPTYNLNSGKLIVDRKKEYQTSDGNMFKMKFKVISNQKENSEIVLKDIELADGDQEVKIADTSMAVTLNKDGDSSSSGDGSGGDSSIENDNNSTTNDSKANDLPNTGDRLYLVYIVVGILVVASICLALYLVKSKKSKNNA